jgi:hypothetical protein
MCAAIATNDTMKRLVHKMRLDRLREAG